MHSPSRDCQINAKFMYRKSGKIHDRPPCGFLSFFPSSTVSAFSVYRPQTLHLSHDQDFDNARTRTELHARVIESCKISTTLTNFTITNIKPSPESQSRCEQNKPMVRQTVNMCRTWKGGSRRVRDSGRLPRTCLFATTHRQLCYILGYN